jgi:hypothetical protein
VLLFEESSSTTFEFKPNAFVDITDYMEFKVECIKSHNTQSRKLYMQENIARSLGQSRYVLSKIGRRPDGMAEAFIIFRFQIVSTKTNKIDSQQLTDVSSIRGKST